VRCVYIHTQTHQAVRKNHPRGGRPKPPSLFFAYFVVVVVLLFLLSGAAAVFGFRFLFFVLVLIFSLGCRFVIM
jgi:hypothetical protein